MILFRLIACTVALSAVSACGSSQFASRNAPFELIPGDNFDQVTPAVAVAPEAQFQNLPAMKLASYAIKVPQDLTVSEANLYYPIADIVWRGDPIGDRKDQIGYIFQEAVTRTRTQITEGRPVIAEIELERFHSVTEKTRYSVGGTHSISFFLTLRDAETGQPLVNNKRIKSDLNAFGGRRAIEAERQGFTMKERILSHLNRVLAAELNQSGGWTDPDPKIEQAINAI
ncbi:MAG: hypothetical protein JXQ89_21025 [Pelagimonas sp.]